jgi:hypothetical protein
MRVRDRSIHFINRSMILLGVMEQIGSQLFA